MRCLLMLLIVLSCSNSQADLDRKFHLEETVIPDADSAIRLFEDALNSNDIMKSVSLFPLKKNLYDITLLDVSMRLGNVNMSMYSRFPGFEGISPYYSVFEFSKPYTAIKLKMLCSIYPEMQEYSIVTNKEDVDKLKEKMDNANSRKIEVSIIKKIPYKGGSLYKYSESFLFICSISGNGVTLCDEASFRVSKIDGAWRIESVTGL